MSVSTLLRSVLTAAACLGLVFALLAPAQAQRCLKERFEDAGYVVCTVDPLKSDLRLFWKNADGEPYRLFSNVAAQVRAEGRQLVFALNAGMYRTDFSPLGLYVENGQQLRRADTTRIDKPAGQVPNFYKKPNGIFFLGEHGAGILPTSQFVDARPDARFATQSGPMLVINGKLHPALIPGSTTGRVAAASAFAQAGSSASPSATEPSTSMTSPGSSATGLRAPTRFSSTAAAAPDCTCRRCNATTSPGMAVMARSSGWWSRGDIVSRQIRNLPSESP